MEALEREFAGVDPAREPGRFAIEPWTRTDASGAPGGGGRMAMLRGRLFEKMGAHCSTVYGAFPAGIRRADSGRGRRPALLGGRRLGDRPSLEPACPDGAHEHAPRAHDEDLVRRRRGSDADARRAPRAERSGRVAFHAAMRAACERHPTVADAERYKAWCDEYFFLKHRNEPRGIGGIFFDGLNSAGDAGNSAFDADFAFVRDVGESFVAVYSEIVRRNAAKAVDRSASARNNSSAAAVMSSSICSTIAARSSD